MKKSESGSGFLLRYTLLFAVVSVLAFLPFMLSGKSFVNRTDGMTQYLVYLRYMGQYLRNCFRELLGGSFSFPSYDFSIGLGDDIGQIVRFHPLDFLSAVVPSRYTEELYAVILFLRLYLAGVSFSLFAFYWRRHPQPEANAGSGRSWSVHPVNILSGAIVYVFCGYMLLRVVNHPTYAAPFIVFPLLLTGAEKVMRREGFLLFPAMVFLGFWSNYYFMYIMSWGLFVYVIVRFFDLYEKRPDGDGRLKPFLVLAVRMVLLYLLGLAMSFATLLPTLLRYSESIRTSSAAQGTRLLVYSDVRRYFAWFLNLISPYQGSGNGVNLNFSVIVFPCLVILFLLPWKVHRSLKLFLIVNIFVLLIPALGYVLAAFNRENNRWMFLPALCLGMCVVFAADHIRGMSRRNCLILIGAAAVFIAAVGMQTLLFGVSRYNLAGVLELCAAVFLLFAVRDKSENAVRICVLLITCGSAALNAYITYTPSMGDVERNYIDAGKTIARYENNWRSQAAGRITDPSFYRIEAFGVNHLMDNCAQFADFNSTSEYNSILNASWIDAMKLENNKDMNGITTVHGMDARPVSLNLAHAKYYVTQENGLGLVPYGYEEDVSLSTDQEKVFVCRNPLAFGFSSDTFVTRQDYEKLTPLEREMVQLYAAVIEDKDDSGNDTVSTLSEAGLSRLDEMPVTIREEDAKILEVRDAEYANGKLKAHNKWGVIEINADQRKGYDCYLCLDHLVADRATAIVKVETDYLSSMVKLRSKDELYTLGREDYLVHLGYGTKDGSRRVRICFWDRAGYQLSGIRLCYVPMRDFDRAVDRLNEESLTQERVSDGEAEGTITLESPKLVVFSIPWAKGWTLEVDGEKVPLLRTDVMYLSAMLKEGTHSIRLVYETPGVRTGICIALTAAGVWVVLAICSWRKKRGSNRE